MSDKPTLTKAQWRITGQLFEGQKLYWSVSFNSYFIGIPGAEHNSKRVQQITVFELKAAGVINSAFALTEAGRKLAAERFGKDDSI